LTEVHYWKDHQQNEVDFTIKQGPAVKQLIQVTHAAARDEVRDREVKSLLKAGTELRCRNLLVITWDYEDEIREKNKRIKCLPLWKWLLHAPV